jgi:hypothetical protein
MNATAITRPCTGCKKHFIGVAPGLCPACEKDSAFYKASRKKGDPREFLPYPELLDQWRRRRAECRDFKKAAGFSATERAAWAQAEQEKSYLLAVLNALNADLDPALELGAELDKVRAELGRVTAHADYLAQRVTELQAGKPEPWEAAFESLRDLKAGGAVPPEQWRRLVQLAHPDKHGGSTAAVEATRWLLENRA